jgi:hypothetical protein
LGETWLVTPLFSFWFFVIVFSLSLDIGPEYALLGIVFGVNDLLVVIGQSDSYDSFKRNLFPPTLTLRGVLLPMSVAIVAVLGPLMGYAFFTGQALTRNSFSGNWSLFTSEVLLVAPVEELFFRWLLPKVFGGVVPQILFAISHPSVRGVILSNPSATVVPFIYFFAFGLLFQQVAFMGIASDTRRDLKKYLGIPATIGAHAAFNTGVILYPATQISGFNLSFFSTQLGGLEALLLGVVLLGFLWRRLRRS